MSKFPVTTRSLWELRWLIFWFGAGLALYGAGIVWLFPTFEEAIAEVEYPPEVLAFFGAADLSNPAEFITAEFQSFAVLIVMIYAVVAATGQLAGEEGRGTLESLLAQPISRSRLILEKAMAVLGGAVLIGAIICLGWLASAPFVDLHGEVTLVGLVGMTFGMFPAVVLFAALGFWFGAIAPSRSMAASILVALAIASYLAASLAQAVEPIEWMRYLSPYYYSDAMRYLTDGPIWWHQVGLLVAAAIVFALAVRTFDGREIDAKRWQLRAMVTARPRAAEDPAAVERAQRPAA